MNGRTSSMPARSFALLGVCALTLLAAILRLWGIGFALPQMLEDDGGVIVQQVALMRGEGGAPELDENWGLYPHLVARIAAIAPGGGVAPVPGASLADHLASAAAPHVHARRVVALLSLLCVPATWLLARRFMTDGFALLAAALVAASLLFTTFAAESRPHAAAAAFAVLAVVASLRLAERGDLASYAWAGIAAGLAIASLQSGIAVLLPLATAHFLRQRDPARRSNGGVLVALAITALCFALFYARSSEAAGAGEVFHLDPGKKSLRFFGHNVFIGEFDGGGFVTVLWSLWSFEPLTAVLALAGLAAWLVSIRGRIDAYDWFAKPTLAVVLSYVLPYLCAIGMYGRTYERFALQLVPFAACLAAYGAMRAFDRLPRAAARTTFLAMIALLFLAIPSLASARLAALRSTPEATQAAADWLAANADARKERILMHPFLDLPLARGADALREDEKLAFRRVWRGYTPWRMYQSQRAADLDGLDGPAGLARFDIRTLPFMRKKEQEAFERDAFAYLARTGARFVVIPVQITREGAAIFHELRSVLQARARLVARFPARADGEHEVVFEYEDRVEAGRPHWTAQFLFGDPVLLEVLEIYELAQ